MLAVQTIFRGAAPQAAWAGARAVVGYRGLHSSLKSLDAAKDLATPKLTSEGLNADELVRPDIEFNNITPSIAKHLGRGLLHRKGHPLATMKQLIFDSFKRQFPDRLKTFDDLHPVVATKACFDDLLIPEDHVSRSKSDTFYYDDKHVLRTHTSAHQTHLMREGHDAFLVAGDVYRRDEIDQSHYPVFHQIEGVVLNEEGSNLSDEETMNNLKTTLETMVRDIYGDVKMRWVDAYFPFTDPSTELEIWFNEEWLEVLGAGVIHKDILKSCGLEGRSGFAFGIGAERTSMVLFDVPDIRLFWTEDARFHEQFKEGQISKFKPYSKFPPCTKDVSFWLSDSFHENDFYALVREIGGDLVERVELIDKFLNKKTGRTSHCYRITYRHMDRSLTNEEIDRIQEVVRETIANQLHVELR